MNSVQATMVKEGVVPGKTSTLNALRYYSNSGLRATYQHILGIQGMARKAKEVEVGNETQTYLDAILKEASHRKVIL